MPDIGAIILIPIVFIVMAAVDGAAFQSIGQIAGANAFWYDAGLVLVEIAAVGGMIRAAL